MTGQRCGLITVKSRAPDVVKQHRRYIAWYCDCDCGTKNFIQTTERLRKGKYKSCGCLSIKNQYKQRLNKYDLTGEYAVGYTSKGEEFYFDKEDYERIKNYTWYIGIGGYVLTASNNRDYFLFHRLVTNAEKDKDVDHINHDKTNNTKQNLRVVTTQENCMNQKLSKRNTSGKNGVSFNKLANKWCATIGYKNKCIPLGCYVNKEDAIKSRIKAEETYYGEFSYDTSIKLSKGVGLDERG